jgi:hypothetical protein
MKKQQPLILVIALLLMGGTAGALAWLKTHQKLGRPGIKATAIPGSVMMNINLPEHAPGFASTNMPEPEVVLGYLPKDTSYVGRLYTAPDGLQINSTVILMGADRTSIHKPDYCLPGQGWQILDKTVENIPVAVAKPYDLPVAKWVVANSYQGRDGQKVEVRGLYVFWFVAENEQTPSHYQYLRWLARDLLRTGVLQRWAYVSYFAACAPGQEDAAFARMKNLIASSVPEFQLPPARP